MKARRLDDSNFSSWAWREFVLAGVVNVGAKTVISSVASSILTRVGNEKIY